MPFDEMDIRDLIEFLEKHPDWKAELLRVLLTEELLRLPQLVAQLAAQVERLVYATERHEQVLQRHEQLLQQILEVQYRHEQTLQRHEQLLQQILETQLRHEQALQRHEEILQRHEQLLQQILEVQYRHERRLERLERDIAPLKGMAIEWRIYRNAPAYLARFVRRCRLLSHEELEEILEKAVDEGRLSDAETDDIRLADFIVYGRSRQDRQELYVVIEASWGLGIKDVERAARRARLFARTGKRAMPAVLGSWISPEATQLAHQTGVEVAIVPYDNEEEPEE
ncbi:MAG: hypothetical protein ABDI19_01595 [Armatimonadota bacterium]